MRCDDEIRESRLRRMAKRQGLMLTKSAQHEPHTADLYWLATIADGSGHRRSRLLVSPAAGMTIDGVEEYLTYGTTRTVIMEYLIRSYGPAFVEELVKHLPRPHAARSPSARE